jgi:hypothetical protein
MGYTNVITEQAADALLKLIRSWDGYEMRTMELCNALQHVQSALIAEKNALKADLDAPVPF